MAEHSGEIEQKMNNPCSCTWQRVAPPPADIPVMSKRDEACSQHGDDTEWWARIQALAAALSGSGGRG